MGGGGTDYTHHITTHPHPRIFRPSYSPGTGYQNETFVCLKAGYHIQNSSQTEIEVNSQQLKSFKLQLGHIAF